MGTEEKKKLMLFDTILDGHHSDYINHIIDFWLEHQLQHELYVVTPMGFRVESEVGDNVHLVIIDQDTVDKTTVGNMVSRGFSVW
jgi:acetate kinase